MSDPGGVEKSQPVVNDVGEDVVLQEFMNGAVKKKIIRVADPKNTTENAPFDSEIYVHYEVFLASNDKLIDSSRDRECEHHWTLGGGHTDSAPLWENIVSRMFPGEVADFFCSAALVYSRVRRPPALKARDYVRVRVEFLYWRVESDVVYDGRIKKHRLSKGVGFQMPSDGSIVSVKYVGRLDDGTVFDDQSAGVDLTLCKSDIVEGLEEGIKGMTATEHSVLRMDSSYAFGPQGDVDMGVPPYAQVHYDVELVSFKQGIPKWEMNLEQKIDLAEFRRKQGNAFFNSGRFDRAYRRYQQALDVINFENYRSDEDGDFFEDEPVGGEMGPRDVAKLAEQRPPELKEAAQKIEIACNNNMSAVRLKEKSYGEVMSRCKTVLRLDPDNLKAMYRLSVSLMESAQSDVALKHLDRALEIQPENQLFQKMRKRAVLLTKKADRNHRQRFGGWCDRASVGDEGDNQNQQNAAIADKELSEDDEILANAKVVEHSSDGETVVKKLASSS